MSLHPTCYSLGCLANGVAESENPESSIPLPKSGAQKTYSSPLTE